MHKDILVIDDNPDIRFLICNILKEQNFDVRSAANYDQAVIEINRKLPDLAIIDIKLDKTDKDGIDLLKLVISKKSGREIKYFANYDMMNNLVDFLFAECCVDDTDKSCQPSSKRKQQ